MKYIYTLGFAALVLAILMAFSTMQPGTEKKNDKGNQQQGKSEGKSKDKGNQGRHGNNSRSGESRRGGNHQVNRVVIKPVITRKIKKAGESPVAEINTPTRETLASRASNRAREIVLN